MYDQSKPKRKWQNLLHRKCPNCDTRLELSKSYLVCPNQSPTEAKRNCFFIKLDRAIEFLRDTQHPANFCLTNHERASLEEHIKALKES